MQGEVAVQVTIIVMVLVVATAAKISSVSKMRRAAALAKLGNDEPLKVERKMSQNSSMVLIAAIAACLIVAAVTIGVRGCVEYHRIDAEARPSVDAVLMCVTECSRSCARASEHDQAHQ